MSKNRIIYYAYFKIFCCLTVKHLLQLIDADFQSFQASQIPELDDRALTTDDYLISSRNNLTELKECMLFCSDQTTCMTFGYHSGTHECQLYNATFLYKLNTTESSGWRFYNHASADCPVRLEFVNDRVNNLCVHISTPALFTQRAKCTGCH